MRSQGWLRFGKCPDVICGQCIISSQEQMRSLSSDGRAASTFWRTVVVRHWYWRLLSTTQSLDETCTHQANRRAKSIAFGHSGSWLGVVNYVVVCPRFRLW